MRIYSPLAKASLLTLVGYLLLAVSAYPRLEAQELRIETDVYADDGEESLSHSVTLFDENTVYDFSDDPARIVIFRGSTPTRPGEFIILDLASQRRTEISLDRINSLIDKVTHWAAEQKDPLLKFSATPKFEQKFDAGSGILDLTSEIWSYRVATIPAENSQALFRYKEFTDWFAKLNSMMSNTPPPGPRLALNSSLEKNGVVPVEIRRTLNDDSTLRAVHLVTWRLSRDDKIRLDETRRMLSTFDKVSNEEFVALSQESGDVRGQSFD